MSETTVDKKIQRPLVGVVVSAKMDKSIVVQITRKEPHKLYGKYVTRSTKLHVHDEDNQSKEGDKVMIKPSRPMSKKKSWALVEVLERAE